MTFGPRIDSDSGRPNRPYPSLTGRLAALLALALIAAIFPVFSAGPALAAESLVKPRAEGTESRNAGLAFDLIAVQAWPEYDAPQVLVMSEFSLPPDTVLPVAFDMPIPKGAQVTALGEVDAQGQYIDAGGPPEVDRTGEDWDIAHIEVSQFPSVEVEYYYDPGLTLEGTRQFEFVYELAGDAKEAGLAIQQPFRSEGFNLQPPLERTTTEADGFTYKAQTFPNLEGGDQLTVTIEYTKDDDVPSVPGGFSTQSDSTEPAQAGGGGGGDGGSNNGLYAVLGVVAFALLGAIGYGVLRNRNNQAVACAECGTPWDADDAFCTKCGAPRE